MRLPTKKIEGKSVSFHGLTSISTRIDKFPTPPIFPSKRQSIRFRFTDFDTNERTNSFAFTRGKLLLLLLNTARKKEKKTNNWTKKYRFVDQRIVESRCSCRIEIASSLKFDRCFHSKYLKIDV